MRQRLPPPTFDTGSLDVDVDVTADVVMSKEQNGGGLAGSTSNDDSAGIGPTGLGAACPARPRAAVAAPCRAKQPFERAGH